MGGAEEGWGPDSGGRSLCSGKMLGNFTTRSERETKWWWQEMGYLVRCKRSQGCTKENMWQGLGMGSFTPPLHLRGKNISQR